jgi:hypothetical protein
MRWYNELCVYPKHRTEEQSRKGIVVTYILHTCNLEIVLSSEYPSWYIHFTLQRGEEKYKMSLEARDTLECWDYDAMRVFVEALKVEDEAVRKHHSEEMVIFSSIWPLKVPDIEEDFSIEALEEYDDECSSEDIE